MDIRITGRNTAVDEELKNYIEKRIAKLARVYARIDHSEVILSEEKERKRVEIIVYLRRNQLVAKESSTDIYASVDSAIDSVKKQLRRLTGRLRSRRRRSVFKTILGPMMGARDEYGDLPGKDRPPIVRMALFADKPMLPEEARVELDVMGKDFVMFKNSDTGESNVIYKRSDGTYGLIEPKF